MVQQQEDIDDGTLRFTTRLCDDAYDCLLLVQQ